MVYHCCGLERYSYVGVLKQICNYSYFWAVVCKCGPNCLVFLPVVCAINSVLLINKPSLLLPYEQMYIQILHRNN